MVRALPSAWDLTGRTAVVTGAGSDRGIGMASARALGDLGAQVLLTATTDRVMQRARELAEAGIAADAVVGDLTDPDTASRVVDRAIQRFGAVDILVNNAGMTSVSQPADGESGEVAQMTWDAWRTALARNLDTAFLMCQAVLPGMVEAGFGRIVTVSSVTGPEMAMRGEPAYAAAKAGLVGLTRALAVDHGASGITVNAIAPGWIATASQTDHERRQGAQVPMQRSGTPEEIASAVAWLASPGAGYITGQCLVIDGGNSVAEERA